MIRQVASQLRGDPAVPPPGGFPDGEYTLHELDTLLGDADVQQVVRGYEGHVRNVCALGGRGNPNAARPRQRAINGVLRATRFGTSRRAAHGAERPSADGSLHRRSFRIRRGFMSDAAALDYVAKAGREERHTLFS